MATGSAAKIVSFPIKNGIICTYQKFWTNFSRERTKDFEILEYDPEIPGYWCFQTNIEKDDFDFMMTPDAIRRFLYQMADLYRGLET